MYHSFSNEFILQDMLDFIVMCKNPGLFAYGPNDRI